MRYLKSILTVLTAVLVLPVFAPMQSNAQGIIWSATGTTAQSPNIDGRFVNYTWRPNFIQQSDLVNGDGNITSASRHFSNRILVDEFETAWIQIYDELAIGGISGNGTDVIVGATQSLMGWQLKAQGTIIPDATGITLNANAGSDTGHGAGGMDWRYNELQIRSTTQIQRASAILASEDNAFIKDLMLVPTFDLVNTFGIYSIDLAGLHWLKLDGDARTDQLTYRDTSGRTAGVGGNAAERLILYPSPVVRIFLSPKARP